MTTDKRDNEIFISIDVEANGPCPIKNSMLSIGAAVCDSQGYLLKKDTHFYENLLPLEGSSPDPDTMNDFWKKFPKEYEATQTDQIHPKAAMEKLCKWVDNLPGFKEDKTIVVNPSVFDMSYIWTYQHYLLGKAPLGFKVCDIQSYANAVLVCTFHDAAKRNWPNWWLSKSPHTHHALDDAYEQLDIWLRIRASNLYGFDSHYAKNLCLKAPKE